MNNNLVPPKQEELLRFCRLKSGEIWRDSSGRHVVGCGNCTDAEFMAKLCPEKSWASLAIQDPPYNFITFDMRSTEEYIAWCHLWLDQAERVLSSNSSLYIWLGAHQEKHYQPLPQFMQLMEKRGTFESRSFITMRNQRGYGTQRNWMAARQELLYYTKGNPVFHVQYTDIPKAVRGYYKTVGSKVTENLERSKSMTIRASNVWIDIQQVFYRLEENVNLCYAQKPLKAIERIIAASSSAGDTVVDFFSHSGTTLLACERLGRKCITCDIDPIFVEITIRRLERYRATGKIGWQREDPFQAPREIINDKPFPGSASS